MWQLHPLLFTLLAGLSVPVFAFTPEAEIAALHTLYNATIGDKWNYLDQQIKGKHWNFSLPYNLTNPCNELWYGVTCTKTEAECDTEKCSILKINLSLTSLKGTLPDALTLLTSLNRFSVAGNQIGGSLPDWFVQLPDIYYIGLWENYFTGSIPISWTALPALNYLDIIDNFITGTIPLGFGNLTNFATLRASANLLSGALPSSIVATTRFNNIEVESNWLIGSLPELGVSIRTVIMSHNYFSGSIPASYMSYASLNDIYLVDNFVTGMLPKVLAINTRMQYLHFDNNIISGSLPASLTNLVYLLSFNVGSNLLTGLLNRDDAAFAWESMSFFDVSYNNMRGLLPMDLFIISAMRYLFLHGNAFSGSIPSDIVYHSEIKQLSFFGNKLTGTVPAAIAAIPHLQALLIQNNKLSGRISEVFRPANDLSLTPFPSLQLIDISSNRFSGSIPAELFQLPNIQHVAIVQNCFDGSIPAEVCDAKSLEALMLEGLRSGEQCRDNVWDPAGLTDTYFTRGIEGSIPECIFEMTNLRTLHITGNRLSGTIPSSLNMSQLLDLKLSDNRLSGRIPRYLQQNAVTIIDLSRNRLQGNFEVSPHISVSPSSLTLSVNRLSGHIAKHFETIDKVDVLAGNLFYCDSRDDIPSHDPDSSTYVCGSDAYDLPLLAWSLCCGFLSLTVAILFFVLHFQRDVHNTPLATQIDTPPKALSPHLFVAINSLRRKYLTWWNTLSETAFCTYSQARYFVLTLRHVRFIACRAAAFILVWYCALYYCTKIWGGYGTHVYQYRWMFSAAYLSGILPAVLMLITLFCISCTLLFRVYAEYNRLSLLPSESITRKLQQSKQVDASTDIWINWKSYGYIVSASLINIVVVLIVKGIYVYLLIWRDISASFQVALNISLSLFDVIWNAVIVTKAVSLFPPLVRNKIRIRWHLLLLLFNSIVAPMIAAACTDRNCFVEVFVGREEVTSSSSYDLCSSIQVSSCKSYETLQLSTTFTPPFAYSYQCMSAILTNFIPVFLFSHIILGFVLPILLLATMTWMSSSPKVRETVKRLFPVPGVLFPSHNETISENSAISVVMRPGIILSNLLHHLTVMLTFGIAAPPLAICIAWTINVMTGMWCVAIGRYYHCHCKATAGVANIAPLERLNDACEDIWQGPMKAVWVIVDCAGLFFACLSIDMIGDNYGWQMSVYFIVLPVIAALLLLRLICKLSAGQIISLWTKKRVATCNMEVSMSPLVAST